MIPCSIEGAGDEKHRLEEKQRAARRKRHEGKEEWVPRYGQQLVRGADADWCMCHYSWFKKDTNPYTGELEWVYTGCYWERDFSVCPDIY